MLNLVLGKAKTGKSKYIMDKMDEAVNSNLDVIFFVPSQMRMLAEEKYINVMQKSGIINIDFTTISDFVKKYNSEHNLTKDVNYISKMDKYVILSRIIEESKDKFEIFKKCKNCDGFINTIGIYMDLFRKNNINLDKINENDANIDLITKLKLEEIYMVYNEYSKYQKSSKYIDSIDEIDIFCDNFVEDNKKMQNTKIFFDSYNNFTEPELKFIKKLLSLGYDVTISVSSNILDYAEDKEDLYDINKISNLLSSKEDDIFYIYNLTVINLIKIAKKAEQDVDIIPCFSTNEKEKVPEDILYLRDNLFPSDSIVQDGIKKAENIGMYHSTNAHTQIESIAKDIISKVKNENARFLDFAIYMPGGENISYIIKNIFVEYGIYFHLDLDYNITSNLIYKYIYYILEMSSYKIDFGRLFGILKLGLLDVSTEKIAMFENYCLEYNITEEYRFKADIKDTGAYDINEIKDFMDNVVGMYFKLKSKMQNSKSAKEIVQNIYNHLKEAKVLENLEALTLAQENSPDLEIKYIASLNKLVWDSICEMFDSICKIYDSTDINIVKFFKIFKCVSNDITKKSVPPSIDEVQILDINVSKTSPKKYVYFILVNENKMPSKVSEDMIFSDADIRMLEENYLMSIRQTSNCKALMQNYNIYEAISNATNKLYFYYIDSDEDGKSLRPSSLITSIKSIMDIDVKSEDAIPNVLTLKSLAETLNYNVLNRGAFDEETVAMYRCLTKNDNMKGILEYIRNDENLSKETISKMYDNKDLTSSVSKIESFKRCPFAYFVKYSLNVDERKVYKITSLDLGSFMHKVLEKFCSYITGNGIPFSDVRDNEEYLKILDDIVNETLDSDLRKHKDSIKYLVLKRKLLKAMRRAVNAISASFSQSEFKPYKYELEFSERAGYKPMEIKLSNDVVVKIIGKIDRVDTAVIDNEIYARIVDYKSSSRDLSIDDVREGTSLQLMTYLSAFISGSAENIKPAGVMYFNLSDNILKLGEYVSEDSKIQEKIIEGLRMKGIFLSDVKVLEFMDKKIATKDRLINVSLSTAKSGKPSKSLLNKDEFDEVMAGIKDILKDILNEMIVCGVTKIKPIKKEQTCKMCAYASICRKDNMC